MYSWITYIHGTRSQGCSKGGKGGTPPPPLWAASKKIRKGPSLATYPPVRPLTLFHSFRLIFCCNTLGSPGGGYCPPPPPSPAPSHSPPPRSHVVIPWFALPPYQNPVCAPVRSVGLYTYSPQYSAIARVFLLVYIDSLCMQSRAWVGCVPVCITHS